MLHFFGFQRAESAVFERALTGVMRDSAAKLVGIARDATTFNRSLRATSSSLSALAFRCTRCRCCLRERNAAKAAAARACRNTRSNTTLQANKLTSHRKSPERVSVTKRGNCMSGIAAADAAAADADGGWTRRSSCCESLIMRRDLILLKHTFSVSKQTSTASGRNGTRSIMPDAR